ncbi:hypothetical protein C7212DRAFT_347938 [Tuber magnatum]|uniref:Uncharacterized protein n=1 Tax=Tuber magnatum TaxID=42249 RepID=A0A317SDS8_9PEZI|nr:hypothetical protein C7212DRAFT_347938 [Tuber magnatum]
MTSPPSSLSLFWLLLSSLASHEPVPPLIPAATPHHPCFWYQRRRHPTSEAFQKVEVAPPPHLALISAAPPRIKTGLCPSVQASSPLALGDVGGDDNPQPMPGLTRLARSWRQTCTARTALENLYLAPTPGGAQVFFEAQDRGTCVPRMI